MTIKLLILSKLSSQIGKILNSAQEGDGFSAKALEKSRFHCQNDWSSNGPAGQFKPSSLNHTKSLAQVGRGLAC